MAPLRVSTTKSEWLPDDPTAFVPSRPWKLPFITTWDDSRNQNHPTDSAEEAEKHAREDSPKVCNCTAAGHGSRQRAGDVINPIAHIPLFACGLAQRSARMDEVTRTDVHPDILR